MNVTYWQDQMLKSKNFDDLNRFRFWTTKTFAVVFAPQIISRRRESSPSSARCPWDSTTDGIKSVFLLSHSFCCSLMLKFKLSNNGYGKKLLKTTIHNLSYIIILYNNNFILVVCWHLNSISWKYSMETFDVCS
jgi:hypothetical protein